MKSFALGFVKGLTNGFTRNIAMEQEARGADDQRVADIENLMIQASLDPKKRVPEQVGSMLKDAQGQLDKREPIDIFGRAGPRLKLDMDKIAGLVNESDDEKKFYDLGKYKIPISSDFYEAKTAGKDKANLFFQTFTDYIKANPTEVVGILDYLNSDKGTLYKKAFNDDFRNYAGFFNKDNLIKKVSQDGNTTVLFKPDFKKRFSTFVGAFENILKNEKTEIDIEIDSFVDKFSETEDNQKKEFPKNSFVFYNNEDNIGIFSFDDPEKYSQLNNIAIDNGFRGKNNVSKFVEAYRRSIQKDRPNIQVKEDGSILTNVFDKGSSNIRNYLPNLFHAINLRQLGANRDVANIDDRQKLDILKYAGKKGLSRGQLIKSIAPLLKPSENDKAFFDSMLGYEATTSEVNKDELFKEFVGMNIADFKKGYTATAETKRKINALLISIGKTSASGAITQELTSFFGNLTFKEGGTIKGLARMIAGENARDGDVSLKRIEDIISKVRGEGYSIYRDTLELGLQESMVIFLAASMARAVDPSGRLSNQDFEVQMRRLGVSGLFTSKESKVVMLKDVQNDFNRKFERIEIINKILSDSTGKGLNKRQLQQLMANERLNAILDTYEGAETMRGKVRNKNEQYKGRNRYVPEIINGQPTGKYIDQRDPFGDKLEEKDFAESA